MQAQGLQVGPLDNVELLYSFCSGRPLGEELVGFRSGPAQQVGVPEPLIEHGGVSNGYMMRSRLPPSMALRPGLCRQHMLHRELPLRRFVSGTSCLAKRRTPTGSARPDEYAGLPIPSWSRSARWTGQAPGQSVSPLLPSWRKPFLQNAGAKICGALPRQRSLDKASCRRIGEQPGSLAEGCSRLHGMNVHSCRQLVGRQRRWAARVVHKSRFQAQMETPATQTISMWPGHWTPWEPGSRRCKAGLFRQDKHCLAAVDQARPVGYRRGGSDVASLRDHLGRPGNIARPAAIGRHVMGTPRIAPS